jgi:RNA polymerase sigma factor (sigma-70 family)
VREPFPDLGKTLPREERDRRLAAYVADRTLANRNAVVEANLGLVFFIIAREFRGRRLPPRVELDDVISAGMEGLIRGVDGYDPSHDTQLNTYCVRAIRSAILNAFLTAGRKKRSIPTVALTGRTDAADARPTAEQARVRAEELREAQALVAGLGDRERDLLMARVLHGNEHGGLNVREVARRHGITGERGCQIVVSTINTLRAAAGNPSRYRRRPMGQSGGRSGGQRERVSAAQ